MLKLLLTLVLTLGQRLKQALKGWSKPETASLLSGALADLTRSRRDLLAENALLRHQLIVLKRQINRPQLTRTDRGILLLLARCTSFWQQVLHLIQPDTLLRWHRDLFRLYWRRRSKSKSRAPRLAQETVALIKQMATDNRLWGAERIRGELLKLDIKVCKRTVQKYMAQVRQNPAGQQTWATFLKNHAPEIWACDFTTVHDLFFRPLYIFVIIQLHTRRIVHAAVTRSPTDDWTAQQLREATPWGQRPKYLIRDRDDKFGPLFSKVAERTGLTVLKTPVRAPKANAFCERFIGSLKRECLDQCLILHQAHLRRTLKRYLDFYHHARPHQGLDQRLPFPYPLDAYPPTGKVVATPVLNGLHHTYSRAPYLH
jgi:transposase InsO family protein